jgi:predicted nucleotidyltransferase
MRLTTEQIDFLKENISAMYADADIFLFGSRTNSRLKGGDIDILVIGKEKLSLQQTRTLKIAFYKQFGEQKIDIVSLKEGESSTFKDLIISEAIKL